MVDKKLVDYQRTIIRLKLEKFILYNLYMDYFPELKGDVIIYGAGELGKLLLRCFESLPKLFIDVKDNIVDICDIPVLPLKQCTREQIRDDDIVIITPVWAYDLIFQNIKDINPRTRVISLERLVEKL